MVVNPLKSERHGSIWIKQFESCPCNLLGADMKALLQLAMALEEQHPLEIGVWAELGDSLAGLAKLLTFVQHTSPGMGSNGEIPIKSH